MAVLTDWRWALWQGKKMVSRGEAERDHALSARLDRSLGSPGQDERGGVARDSGWSAAIRGAEAKGAVMLILRGSVVGGLVLMSRRVGRAGGLPLRRGVAAQARRSGGLRGE